MLTETNIALAREKLDRLHDEIEGLYKGAVCNHDKAQAEEIVVRDATNMLAQKIFFIALNNPAGPDRDNKLDITKKEHEIATSRECEIEKAKMLAVEERERISHIRMSLRVIQNCLKD